METACCRVGWSIVDPLSDRANGRENPVGCQHGKENEKGVKIIPAQIYAGVDTAGVVSRTWMELTQQSNPLALSFVANLLVENGQTFR